MEIWNVDPWLMVALMVWIVCCHFSVSVVAVAEYMGLDFSIALDSVDQMGYASLRLGQALKIDQ